MARIEVEPGELVGVGGEHAAIVATLVECAGLMGAAGQGIAEGAGHAGAAGAGEEYGASWGAHLSRAGEGVDRAGTNLAAAAAAYRETDSGQMRS